jgi:hypothetical protein
MTTKPTNLDEPCGEHFVYREFIECGETWARLASPGGEGIDNVPRAAATFAALRALCTTVLDPAVNRFGRIVLTYGFASPRLTKHIRNCIAPAIDQHAGHEVNRAGRSICPRLGAAADFFVPDVDSREVARWIAESTAFDRMYFYDGDRPLHVSVGPESTRQVVHMRRAASGRRVPRVVVGGSL